MFNIRMIDSTGVIMITRCSSLQMQALTKRKVRSSLGSHLIYCFNHFITRFDSTRVIGRCDLLKPTIKKELAYKDIYKGITDLC